MKEELLELLKNYAYKKGEFKLSSGKTSEHYVNCKPVTLSGRGLTLSSLLILKEVETDYVGGLTLGADPLVSGVALISALDSRLVNGLIVRKEAKGHGTQAYIEGLLPPEGTKITVLEDVIEPFNTHLYTYVSGVLSLASVLLPPALVPTTAEP